MFNYAIRLEQDDNDTVLVTCRDLPEVVTFGEDDGDALIHAQDALAAALSFRMDESKDIPVPSAPEKGEIIVFLPSLMVQKLSLYKLLRSRKITQVSLAESMGADPKTVRRLLDPTHSSRQDLLDRAFLALGLIVEPHIVEIPEASQMAEARRRLRRSAISPELELA